MRNHSLSIASAVVLCLTGAAIAEPASPPSFGVYVDNPATAYDGYVRSSQYVPARDGTRLAVDVYLAHSCCDSPAYS